MTAQYWNQWNDLDESDCNDYDDTNLCHDEVDTNSDQEQETGCCASGCMECIGFDY